MPEDENTQNQQKQDDQSNVIPSEKPKRRRRPRRRKKKKKPQEPQKPEFSPAELAASDLTVAPSEEAEEKEEVFDLEPTEEEVAPEEEPLMEEPLTGEELSEEIVEEVKPEEEETEEAYLAEDKKEPSQPGEEQQAPELPGKIAGEEKPSDFHMEEQSKGPVGWDQLKEAIQEDHTKTEQEMAEGVSPAEADIEPEAEPEEEAPTEEPTPAPAPAPVPTEEVVEAEAVEEAKPTPVEEAKEDEVEKKEVIRIISKYAIGGCIVIAIITAIFVFRLPQRAFEFVTNFFSADGQPAVTETVDTSKEPVLTGKETPSIKTAIIAGQNKGKSLERFEEGVETALISGEDIPRVKRVSPSIQAVFEVGIPTLRAEAIDRIAYYMSVLLQLQNAFSTDIHQLLDASSDRSDDLELHLRELRDVYQLALEAQRDLNEEKDNLKIQFNQVTTEKEQLEKDFFVSTEQLEGNKANDLLNAFIGSSKRQIELKAEFNALNKVAGMFETALGNMDARIKDIELNKKALVQGVRVVDIKGSDLDLIIEEGDLF